MTVATKGELLLKLKSYDEWKHCITVMCGIPLTSEYVEKRISELNNLNDFNTVQFIDTWGESHRQLMVQWFERARQELVS
jgi:hypothetical protein